MSITWRQRLIFALSCTKPGTLTRLHFQLPDPRQPARSLADLRTTLAAILGRRQPHNVPPLHTAQAVHEGVTEEYRILESVNCEFVTYTPAYCVSLRVSLLLECSASSAALPTGDWLTTLTSRARSLRSSCRRVLQNSLWSTRQVASVVLLGSFRALSGVRIKLGQCDAYHRKRA